MKKILVGIFSIGVLCIGLYAGVAFTHANKAGNDLSQETRQNELFPSDEITDVSEEDNEYVKLHNQFVNALNDYSEGKISKEEYESICNSITKKMDSPSEYSDLKEAEEEYKEESGKDGQ